MHAFQLRSEHQHLAWDNALVPALEVEPGDEVTINAVDASGGQLTSHDVDASVAGLDFTRVNPCTGPIAVRGAAPGDVLVVEILEVNTADWAWTANIPGFGLLADDFPDPRLWISKVNATTVRTPIGLEIPTRPMIGTIGVAPASPGRSPLLVPTLAGGNMDVAQMGASTTLRLPVQVKGALFSLGDFHAVQGDGEVCGTGAETAGQVRLRLRLEEGPLSAPRYSFPDRPRATSWQCTTGIGPDLFSAARDATRRAVDVVALQLDIPAVDAYLLCSLGGDLRISEIVDAPNWVVSMHLPEWLTGG